MRELRSRGSRPSRWRWPTSITVQADSTTPIGHDTGDRALRLFARTVAMRTRCATTTSCPDTAVRSSCSSYPARPPRQAEPALHRIREALRDAAGDGARMPTVHGRAWAWRTPPGATTWPRCSEAADRALLVRPRTKGRDRIVIDRIRWRDAAASDGRRLRGRCRRGECRGRAELRSQHRPHDRLQLNDAGDAERQPTGTRAPIVVRWSSRSWPSYPPVARWSTDRLSHITSMSDSHRCS